MGEERKKERRKHTRYQMKEGIFAVVCSNTHQLDKIETLSKGEIAFAVIKSRPPQMGQITEISRGGLSFDYIDNKSDLSQYAEMDILFVDDHFHLSRLPFRLVGDVDLEEDVSFNPLNMKRMAVQFRGLTIKQKQKLDHCLEHYTSGVIS